MNRFGLCRILPRQLVYGAGSVALLALALVLRQWLESSMASHMLLQMPAILVAGVLAAQAIMGGQRRDSGFVARIAGFLHRYDEQSVPGLVALALLLTYWMIPKSLDHVLVSPLAELAKFVSLFAGGLILADCLARANLVIQLFFLGNIAWMMAVVGLLYQDNSTRLCNFYLLDDQLLAGQGLVLLSAALPLLWLWRRLRGRLAWQRLI